MTTPPICAKCDKPLAGELEFSASTHGPRYCAPCWHDVNSDDAEEDRKIDRWHAGYFARVRPTDPDELAGWLRAREDAQHESAITARPEGYYHQPIGTFD